MKVKVTTLTGDKQELEVTPQDTVKHVKVSELGFKKFFWVGGINQHFSSNSFMFTKGMIIYVCSSQLLIFSRIFEVQSIYRFKYKGNAFRKLTD